MAQKKQEAMDSNYKGSLPSQKYFTPQELSNLGRLGKQPLFPQRPPSAKKQAPLPKPTEMSASQSSFYSDA